MNLTFSSEFTNAIEKKQIAEQEAKQAEYNAQKATVDARASVEKAKGEAESNLTLTLARAQAESQRLLRQNVTKDIIQLEYLKRWNGVLPSVLTGNGGTVMLNLGDKQ